MATKATSTKKPSPVLTVRERPLAKTLQEFAESAIADTKTLTPEQIRLIKTTLEPLYDHYRPNPPFIVDALDTLGDTEEVRSSEKYFRETLEGYVTGWNTLNHVYYALSAVYIGFVNEYVRIEREKYQTQRTLERDSTQTLPLKPATQTLLNQSPLPQPAIETQPTAQIGLFM